MGPQTADPHARTDGSSGRRARSHCRNKVVPSNNQNKDAEPTVSFKSNQMSGHEDKSMKNGHISTDVKGTGAPLSQIQNAPVETEPSTPENLAPSLQKSDNREAGIQTDFPPGIHSLGQGGSLVEFLLEELKAIRTRVDSLERIEATTATLATQMAGLVERTSRIESSVKNNSVKIQEVDAEAKANSTKLKEVNAEVVSLKETVELQGRAIVKLTTMKTDMIKRNKDTLGEVNSLIDEHKNEVQGTIKEMNVLLGQQREQVDSFHTTSKRIENNIIAQVQETVEERVDQNISFQKLKDQAFSCRHNLVITGLPEDPSKSPLEASKELFKSLGVKNPKINEAFRLGTPPKSNSDYNRPTIVKFGSLSDRNKIWRKRRNVTSDEGSQRTRIQADLPKELREETNILYRVVRAAASTQKYRSAVVRSYAVQLKDEEYSPRDLERLPFEIRPSTISNPRSDEALAFFTKYSPLSNHHHSVFKIQGQVFHTMEHFLAFKKASLAGNEDLVRRASQSSDPKEAKAILNALKEDHVDQWDKSVHSITLQGLRAKFSQNPHLLAFLRGTNQLKIGEASKNPRWGIGLNLDNPNLLDTSKWDPKGNLLGKCLMSIRQDLCKADLDKKKPNK